MTSDPKSIPPEVIEGFKAGESAAVRHIYRVFAGPVATVARSILGANQAMIDDAVQQTFTKAWKASGTFNATRSFAPWIYTIARRTAIDIARSENRPTKGDHDEQVDIAVESTSMEATWEAFEVRQALQKLPTEERDIVVLSHSLGLTHEQIAQRLAIPIGTVKSRSYRAHKRLRSLLRHLDDQPIQTDTTTDQYIRQPTTRKEQPR